MSDDLRDLDKLFSNSEDTPEKVSDDAKEADFSLVSRGRGPLRARYRPYKLEELVPTCSIQQLKNLIDNPNSSQIFLLEGNTGTGKTTCARIIAKASVCLAENTRDKPCLSCKACKNFESSVDITEINVADQRKIDDVRSLVDQMKFLPGLTGSSKKIYILDEVHQYTADAQQVLLTQIENPPSYILMFLCTTDAHTLNQALIDRSTRIQFKDIDAGLASQVINQVLEQEGINAPEDTRLSFYYQSKGSIRALLNNIQSYIEGGYDSKGWDEDQADAEVSAIAKAILKGNWEDLVIPLRQPNIRKNPEEIRRGLECYLRGVILSAENNVPKNDLSKATRIGNALANVYGSLQKEIPISQYNGLVLKCLRACKSMVS